MWISFSTAFRVLCNAALAEEVSQRVFIALARNAEKLEHRTVLAGWLHQISTSLQAEAASAPVPSSGAN
jgi:DNA-directed RNA polymerase specialized sigma24 family protein